MSLALVDELREVPAFSDLSAGQLGWFADHGRVDRYESGDVIFSVGSEADSMVIVLEGAIEVMFSVGGQQVPFLTQRRGSVTGLLPFSRMRTYAGSGHAAGATRLYRIDQSLFDEMLHVAPGLGSKLVSLMTDRVRESTRLTQQREKMMALGKLAAGLAHEINNPAAAVGRSSDLLRERIDRLPSLTARLLMHAASADLRAPLEALMALAKEPGADADSSRQPPAGARERSLREDAMGAWLEHRGIDESWMLAETFVDAGLAPEELGAALEGTGVEAAGALLGWFDAVLGTHRLAGEIRTAATRVSDLVGAVKIYSHMDRGGVRERVNLTEGIDSTIVMLGHAIKRKQIALERDFATDLPEIEAYPGELNQVWTNLIDNALDAMKDGGILRLEAARDGSMVVVRVIDSGVGIPPEVLPRVFEAFFTTKPVGDGTGLGLDIVQRIVEQQHGGRVDVESVPGRTVFTVRLPIAPE